MEGDGARAVRGRVSPAGMILRKAVGAKSRLCLRA